MLVKEKKPPAPPVVADFTAVQKVVRERFVHISGVIPGSDTARIVVTSIDPKPKASIVVIAPVAKSTLISNVPVADEMKKYQVSVTWVPADKSERTIVKAF